MRITHLSLTNFRNYGRLELEFPEGPTLLHGANAQGKTNLLEAIYYLATTRSPHADQDWQLMNWDAAQMEEPVVVGRLVAAVATSQGPKQIEMRLILERQRNGLRRQALVNRRKVRLMDLLGNLRVVLFLPEDVQLVTGSPAKRRRYLDITLCQSDTVYCHNLSTYNKVLEQRNALLRRIAEQGNGVELLPVYTEKLVSVGSQIFIRRANFVAELAQQAQRIHYEMLTDGRESLRLGYLPRIMADSVTRAEARTIGEALDLGQWLQEQTDTEVVARRFQEVLDSVQSSEIAAGSTRIGPHRDDWHFWVNGRELSSYGSRGQQRSAMLALKLAEIEWMDAATGEAPLLLLDEVVAELDEGRRALLLETVMRGQQAILTATDPAMFTMDFLKQATTMSVRAGQVSLDAPQAVVSGLN
jgi:DNA replication and repair protein RecF